MRYRILLLILCFSNQLVFGSDDKSTGSSSSGASQSPDRKLGLLISYPELHACVHKELENFPDLNPATVTTEIETKAIVSLDGFKRKKFKALIPTDMHKEGVLRALYYWHNQETGESFGVEDPVILENKTGYDSAVVRSELDAIFAKKIDAQATGTGPEYTDKSRHVLPQCGVTSHPFHAGCLHHSLTLDPRCPTCRKPAKPEDAKLDYRYHKGDVCAICCYAIVPSPVVAPIGSRFNFSAAGTGSGAGAGRATTTPAVSPVQTVPGKKRKSYGNMHPRYKGEHTGFGHDRDDSESLS